MSTILKRNRALLEGEHDDDDDQPNERNICHRCGNSFIRLALHRRSCRQHRSHHSQVLKDAQQALANQRSARKRPKLVCSSDPQEKGPGQHSRIESANDIEVRQNRSKKDID